MKPRVRPDAKKVTSAFTQRGAELLSTHTLLPGKVGNPVLSQAEGLRDRTVNGIELYIAIAVFNEGKFACVFNILSLF